MHKSNNLGPWSTPKLPQIPSSCDLLPRMASSPLPLPSTQSHFCIHKFHHSPHSIHFGMCPAQSFAIKVAWRRDLPYALPSSLSFPSSNCWLRRNTFCFFSSFISFLLFSFFSHILYELCSWLRECLTYFSCCFYKPQNVVKDLARECVVVDACSSVLHALRRRDNLYSFS